MTLTERARAWLSGDPKHLPGSAPTNPADDVGADPGAAVDLAGGYHPGGCSCGCAGTGDVGADPSTGQLAALTGLRSRGMVDPATVARNLSGSPRDVAVAPADWDTIAVGARLLDQALPPAQTAQPHLPGAPELPAPAPFD